MELLEEQQPLTLVIIGKMLNKENNDNQEVIEKLFNMMEQFTERIFNLENQTKSQ